MKVIFLDFDGVITTARSKGKLDKDKMLLLKRIVDATGAKIVISSSWRSLSLEDTISNITDTNDYFVGENPFICPEAVVGVTPVMRAFRNSDKKVTFSLPRGCEINRYLDEHREIDDYVILDDDSDMLLCQKDNFVQTDGIDGLTEADVERAIEILNYGKAEDIRV